VTRVGLVGYGGAGRMFHAPLLSRAGLDIVAVATSSRERADQVAQDVPSARVVRDLEALLRFGGLDLVVLASPTGVHVDQALRVVDAGIPVVVDKPLGVDASSALTVVDAAARAGVPLTVFQNRRYDSEFHTLAQVVTDGLVGDVVRAELRWERWRPVPKERWRENAPPEQGGGVLLDLFSHLVDQVQVLFGPIETVYAETFVHTGTVAEHTAFLSGRHESGVVSHLGSTALAAAPGPWLRLLGRQGAYVVGGLGEEVTAFLEWQPLDAEHLGWLVRDGERMPVRRVRSDQADFYRQVAMALTADDPQAAMPVDPRDAVRTLAVLDAARVSAAGGRVVDVITPGVSPV
jgi:predicted dehydrogenase